MTKSKASVESELRKIDDQINHLNENLSSLTLDKMNEAPRQEMEQQTKLSSKEINNSKDIYLKPKRTIGSKEKFNEKYRDDWNFAREYVQFIAENREIVGETIELWTKKFPGVPAEFWEIPVNKPVWGPRYLAEQIKSCAYHRLVQKDDTIVSADGAGTYRGAIVADSLINRIDAFPVSKRSSVFVSGGF